MRRRNTALGINAFFLAVGVIFPGNSFAQNTTSDELRLLRNELKVLREQQEMDSRRARTDDSAIAEELRKLRQIEEQKISESKRIQDEKDREERARKIQEYYAKVTQTAATLESQVSRGTPLSPDQLEWIRGIGMDLKAQLENPNTLMIMEMVRETEQGFTGVGGTLPMSKSEANAAKQRIQRDQSLFNRFAAINRANAELSGAEGIAPTLSPESPDMVVPEIDSQQIRVKKPATDEVEARRRALMEKMRR
jgi:hypothetical protein